MNPNAKNMYCIRCGRKWPIGDHPFGCADCKESGLPASMSFGYQTILSIDTKQNRLARYENHLPYRSSECVSLGEGGTPLISLKKMAEQLHLGGLFSKNEFQNPTGSHKDRMNPFIVARAKEIGAPMVTAASSGNEGVSLACYAAAAGIPCTIVATKGLAPLWQNAICATGADIVFTETSMTRWEYVKRRMDQDHWYTAVNIMDPPVGSSSYGIQGYKTISYELYEQMPAGLPDYILIPTCRGDLLWGIYEGFADLKEAEMIEKIPALVAVEPFPRLALIHAEADCSKHFEGQDRLTPSIGGSTATMQSYLALKKSGGFSVSVGEEEVASSIRRMARSGLYLEESSALSIACLENVVASQKIEPESTVVMIATSHGFKNILDLTKNL